MRHLRFALALLAPGAVVCTMSASAQTRFTWPDTSEHVAHYTNMENCLAAAGRVHSSVLRREDLALDAALAEIARHEDRIEPTEVADVRRVQVF